MAEPSISAVDPRSEEAVAMAAALWQEIQTRYGFVGEDPFDPSSCTGRVGRFWVATHEGQPVGSIALAPLEGAVAEMDVMYVAPSHRGTGLAQRLLATMFDHARAAGVTDVWLRAGEPQPEAMRFYAKAGFSPIEPFGRWVGDDSARCLAIRIASTAG